MERDMFSYTLASVAVILILSIAFTICFSIEGYTRRKAKILDMGLVLVPEYRIYDTPSDGDAQLTQTTTYIKIENLLEFHKEQHRFQEFFLTNAPVNPKD